jgi:hypothetical protein
MAGEFPIHCLQTSEAEGQMNLNKILFLSRTEMEKVTLLDSHYHPIPCYGNTESYAIDVTCKLNVDFLYFCLP